jgi:hypothetical protein
MHTEPTAPTNDVEVEDAAIQLVDLHDPLVFERLKKRAGGALVLFTPLYTIHFTLYTIHYTLYTILYFL